MIRLQKGNYASENMDDVAPPEVAPSPLNAGAGPSSNKRKADAGAAPALYKSVKVQLLKCSPERALKISTLWRARAALFFKFGQNLSLTVRLHAAACGNVCSVKQVTPGSPDLFDVQSPQRRRTYRPRRQVKRRRLVRHTAKTRFL